MKKHRVLSCFLCVLFLCMALSQTVSADFGSKPSIRITFENMPNAEYYGFLLTDYEPDFPVTNRTVTDQTEHREKLTPVWDAYDTYEDIDGYDWYTDFWLGSAVRTLERSYLPPRTFKVLLYFPESDTFSVSPILEKYAYDAYYTIDLAGTVPQDGETLTSIRESYRWGSELFAFFVRMALTVLVEVGIALLFRYRTKPLLYRIAAVNAATQLLLNLLLFFVNFYVGGFAMYIVFILCEGLIFLVEMILYAVLLPKHGGGRWWKAMLYALAANALSFYAGLRISLFIPLMF